MASPSMHRNPRALPTHAMERDILIDRRIVQCDAALHDRNSVFVAFANFDQHDTHILSLPLMHRSGSGMPQHVVSTFMLSLSPQCIVLLVSLSRAPSRTVTTQKCASEKRTAWLSRRRVLLPHSTTAFTTTKSKSTSGFSASRTT